MILTLFLSFILSNGFGLEKMVIFNEKVQFKTVLDPDTQI